MGKVKSKAKQGAPAPEKTKTRAKKWTPEKLSAAEEEVLRKAREVKYDQKDYTVELIAQKLDRGVFFVPPYQRLTVWDKKNKQAFVESLLLNLPIPFMFIAARPNETYEIVDGAQRITTIRSYLNNEFSLGDLDKLATLNRMRFCDLPDSLQRRLNERALRIVVLDPDTTLDARKELFRRVNTHGRKARAAEVRRGAFEGPFMAMVRRLADTPLFKETCPLTDTQLARREDEELIVRFFAYSDEYRAFKHDVEKFLHGYVERHADKFDQAAMEAEFVRTLKFVRDYFPHGFAKPGTHSTPRVRFEAISVGVNLALRKEPTLSNPNLDWLDSDEFRAQIATHGSNSSGRLRSRIEFVRDALLEGA